MRFALAWVNSRCAS